MEVRVSYVRTFHGLLKVLEVVFSLIGLVMYLMYGHSFGALTSYFIGTLVALIVAIVIIIFYITGISEALGSVIYLQTYFHLVWMMYMTAYSAIVLNVAGSNFDLVCAGIFGMLLAVTYLVDAIHGFRKYPPMPFYE
ncbi:hypothetical protein HHI36_006504 [Cryptolaemus montrouzieri]|uniref:MARVEL domain-containing protein n=1 Tax=Cryptolaemus montrouzieri TaxID=559131 RepID=A0ABD2NXA6_9CUCU